MTADPILHRYEIAVLNVLKKSKELTLEELIERAKLGKDEVLWAIEGLSKAEMVAVKRHSEDVASLTEEGQAYAASSLPEITLAKKLSSAKHLEIKSLNTKQERLGFMWAKNKGLVKIEKGRAVLTKKGADAARSGLREEAILKELGSDKEAYKRYKSSEAVPELRKRKLIEVKASHAIESIAITSKGSEAEGNAEPRAEIEVLDRNMIVNGLWRGKRFRAYNVEAPVEPREIATRHPLRKVIDDLREAYIGLGFQEVAGPIIEPAFWVFDYLFVPQHHPARDAQDTFFLSTPETLQLPEKSLVKRIKGEHERAWHSGWSEEVAMQAMPRTHTTSVTGRYMHEITSSLQKDPSSYELPVKLFTVGRNFRNENIDYKHLADFYMTDGIAIGKNLTLANLFDILIRIYKSIGIKIRFKPAYFPFVEPGVEVQVEQDGEWLELGGAGVIRKEVIGMERKNLNVLAWGLGVERILLVKDKQIDSIASLFNTSVGWLRARRI